MASCSQENCDRKVYARGLCNPCYQRLRYNNAVLPDKAERKVTHGRLYAYQKGCRCKDCKAAYSELRKNYPSTANHRAPTPEQARQYLERDRAVNAEVRQTKAHRNGYQWTGPELEIASRDDLSTAEVAEMIGRTIFAVRQMRHKLKVDPRKINLAGIPQTDS